MDHASQIEVVELGDAKEQTKGLEHEPLHEEDPINHTRQPD